MVSDISDSLKLKQPRLFSLSVRLQQTQLFSSSNQGVNPVLSSVVGIEIGPGESSQPLHRDDGKYPIARPHQELIVNTMWALGT